MPEGHQLSKQSPLFEANISKPIRVILAIVAGLIGVAVLEALLSYAILEYNINYY